MMILRKSVLNLLLLSLLSTRSVQALWCQQSATNVDRPRFVASSATKLCASVSTSFPESSEQPSEPAEPSVEASVSVIDSEQDEEAFRTTCQLLCQERNLPFDKVKNARDLSSAVAKTSNVQIQPNRVFRMGRLGDATEADLELLDQLGLQTLVDLRSPTELKDDTTLLEPAVFDEYTNLLWSERKQRQEDNGRHNVVCLRELKPGELPVRSRFWNKKGNDQGSYDAAAVQEELEKFLLIDDQDEDVLSDLKSACGEDVDCGSSNSRRKERHFVSLMDEFKYVKGTVSKLRKRDLTKALLKTPGALVSRRMRNWLKKPFLDEINDGGLPMLNEILLRFGAPGIKHVLELCADRERHPVAFYCTAGKDRTGMIAALLLSVCGVEPEDIVQDYSLSANVYAEINDHKAMVGALSQRNLDPKTFLGAPPGVMRDTLKTINEQYGSVEGYLEWIGFGPEEQEQLRRALMDP